MTNRHYSFLAAAFVIMAVAFSSCSSDSEFEDKETLNVSDAQLPYDSDGIWRNNKNSVFFDIDDYEFSHYVIDGYVYGFTPSKVKDTSSHTPLYSFPYASAAGGGSRGASSPYIVGYWPEFLEGQDAEFQNRYCRIYAEDGDRFQPKSMMVCNNTYMLYALLNGTDFTSKATPGTWVTLNIHGVHLDGTESVVNFYLVNIEDTDIEKGILTTWQKVDLSSLGTCTGMYFTMDCSPNFKDDYGMSVPTYFCIDQIVVND